MRWNGNTGQPPRLLVADRAPLIAAALAALLRGHGYAIAGTSSSGSESQARLQAGGIDIALIDIDLDGPGPLGLLEAGATVPMVVIAPFPDHPRLVDVVQSCAAGIVLKNEHPDTLLHCLAAVGSGGQWFDREAMARAGERLDSTRNAAALTRRECDVARLVAAGQRNRAIAGSLGISEGTVKMHLHNVYAKLGLESRTQLAMDERLRVLG
jgi:DNA-binding NarL/FixJ family response regulator